LLRGGEKKKNPFHSESEISCVSLAAIHCQVETVSTETGLCEGKYKLSLFGQNVFSHACVHELKAAFMSYMRSCIPHWPWCSFDNVNKYHRNI